MRPFSSFRFKRDIKGRSCLCIQENVTSDGRHWVRGVELEVSVVVLDTRKTSRLVGVCMLQEIHRKSCQNIVIQSIIIIIIT
jgi:hypothetical protein